MNTFTFSQKGLFACTFFLPISLFETVSDIWFYVFLHSPSCCCCCALAKLYSTLCDTRTIARQASLSSAISQNLLKLMSIESVMPSNRLILCRPLLLLPSIFPSIKVFSSESALHIRGQSPGASASASVLLMNIQSSCPLGLTGLISLLSKAQHDYLI